MVRNKLMEFFGYEYVLNKKSGEIHNVKKLHKNCNFASLRHGKYISSKKVKKLTQNNTSKFCFWCNR